MDVVADDQRVVLALDRPPAARVEVEERDAVFGRLDLRRVAELPHQRAGVARQLRGATGILQFAREDVGDKRLGRRIGGIEDDHAMPAEQIVEPAGKRRRDRRAGGVAPRQRVERLASEFRRRERRRELAERVAGDPRRASAPRLAACRRRRTSASAI